MKISTLRWRAVAPLLLCVPAFPQVDASAKLQPITTQVRDGGTYHAATRTWTRGASSTASLTGEVLYDNTCIVGFYAGMSATESAADSGRLPSTSSPHSATSLVGSDDAYDVDGFQIAYCTSEGSTDLVVAHWECYGATLCADQTLNATMVSALGIGGAPGSALIGSLSCWSIIIDLRNSTFEFSMNADCDGSYSAPDVDNAFAWEFYQVNGGVNGPAGPLIAGDPFGLLLGTACPYGAGTTFSPNAGPGTGLGTQDAFTTYLPGPSSGGGVYAACWSYGGYSSSNPYASFFHQMSGEKSGASGSAITEFCNGDGSGTPCPCGNNNNGSNGVAGCANSAGAGGGKLTWSGSNSILANDLVLQGSTLQPGQAGLYLQGNNATAGGNGLQFGDGLRCAGGGVVRLQVRNSGMVGASFTTVNIASVGGVSPGDIRRYQLWYRDTAGPCGSGFNFTNALEVVWGLSTGVYFRIEEDSVDGALLGHACKYRVTVWYSGTPVSKVEALRLTPTPPAAGPANPHHEPGGCHIQLQKQWGWFPDPCRSQYTNNVLAGPCGGPSPRLKNSGLGCEPIEDGEQLLIQMPDWDPSVVQQWTVAGNAVKVQETPTSLLIRGAGVGTGVVTAVSIFNGNYYESICYFTVNRDGR